MHPLAEHVPTTRISVRSGPVLLRIPTDAELATLADAIRAGGLDDDQTRDGLDWQPPDPTTAAHETVRHVVTHVATDPGPKWLLPLIVFVDGEPIGRQDLFTTGPFTRQREVASGSWLLNDRRGRGYGTWARAGMLALAWELGARRATTGWRTGNRASQRVSERLGYAPHGVLWKWNEALATEMEVVQAHVTPDRYTAAWTESTTIDGVDDDVRAWLGDE